MDNTESQAFLENVRIYARDRGIPLSTLEKNFGLCPGYLTRAPRSGTGITLQTAVALSRQVNAPIDSLILRKSAPPSIKDGLVRIDTQIARLHMQRAELLMELGE